MTFLSIKAWNIGVAMLTNNNNSRRTVQKRTVQKRTVNSLLSACFGSIFKQAGVYV
jgi:hypothetical protein